ncbi:hypothetical protein SprV_0200551700 [Sparganum proliferum]
MFVPNSVIRSNGGFEAIILVPFLLPSLDACSSAFVSQCTRLSFFGSFCFLASRRGDSTLLTKLSFCHVPLHSKRRQGVSPGSVMANVLYLTTKVILAAACTCGILTSIIVLLICFRKRGQLNRRVLTKMRRRACGAAFSGDASTAASTATREEDGTAGDRTRLNQVFPTGLRLPLLRPLHQLSLHERINRLTDLDFFPARRVQIGNLLYGGCHSRVYSGFVSTVRFVDDVSVPDNRVVLKTLPDYATKECFR